MSLEQNVRDAWAKFQEAAAEATKAGYVVRPGSKCDQPPSISATAAVKPPEEKKAAPPVFAPKGDKASELKNG